jgi:hypothetical protein
MSLEKKIEPASPMYAVVRTDDQGTPFVDGLSIAYDTQGVRRLVDELHGLCPTWPLISPIVTGPRGERFALIECRFIRWEQ